MARSLAVLATATAATAAAALASSSSVPEYLHPLPGLLNYDFGATNLRKVSLSTDFQGSFIASAQEPGRPAKDVIQQYTGTSGCVCFVVRRPG